MATVMKQGKDTPLNQNNSGGVPDVSDALNNWMQPMTFGVVTTTVEGFQSVQTQSQVDFMGVWQPLTDRQLLLKPEGQRAWTWIQLHATTALQLQVDSVVTYLGVQYRIMSRKDYNLYGYIEYHLAEDYTGSGPTVSP